MPNITTLLTTNPSLLMQLFLTVILAVFMLLFLREKYLREKERSLSEELQLDSKLISKALAESKLLIDKSVQKANQILEEAAKSGLKAATASDMGTQLVQEEYRKILDNAFTASQTHFQKYTANLEKQSQELENKVNEYLKSSVEGLLSRFESNLKTIQDRALTSQEESEQSLRAKTAESLINFEQNISNFLAESQEKSLQAINLEVKSARELIETYKQQQFSLIDENIVAVLERTLNLVLRKKLTLKDQVDLVFESLEKAKAEKFLV